MLDGAFELASLPGLAFAFALVVARVGSTVMLLPVLGEAEVPMTVRAGFTLALTLLLLPPLLPLLPRRRRTPGSSPARSARRC